MIKANTGDYCSWCNLGIAPGETALEGSDNDSGALYHGACYSELNRAEGGEFDDADHERRFKAWRAHFGG